MSADNVHFEAISQPRTLSADIPASQKGVYLFYNHTLIFRENILCTFICTFRNSICDQLLTVTIARLNKTSLVSFHVKEEKEKLETLVPTVSFPRNNRRTNIDAGGLLRHNCPLSFHHVT